MSFEPVYADKFCNGLTSSECNSLTLQLYKAEHIDPKLQAIFLDLATAGMFECFKAGGSQAQCQMNGTQLVLDLSKSVVAGAGEILWKSLSDPKIRETVYEFIAGEDGSLKLPGSKGGMLERGLNLQIKLGLTTISIGMAQILEQYHPRSMSAWRMAS